MVGKTSGWTTDDGIREVENSTFEIHAEKRGQRGLGENTMGDSLP